MACRVSTKQIKGIKGIKVSINKVDSPNLFSDMRDLSRPPSAKVPLNSCYGASYHWGLNSFK